MIAGGRAGRAVLSEVFASVSTGFAILLLRHLLDANSMAEAAGVLVAFFRDMGRAAYPVFFAILVGIQVLPLMSGLPYIILAGAIFGPAAGLAVVSAASSFAACISCTIARGISSGMASTLPVYRRRRRRSIERSLPVALVPCCCS